MKNSYFVKWLFAVACLTGLVFGQVAVVNFYRPATTAPEYTNTADQDPGMLGPARNGRDVDVTHWIFPWDSAAPFFSGTTGADAFRGGVLFTNWDSFQGDIPPFLGLGDSGVGSYSGIWEHASTPPNDSFNGVTYAFFWDKSQFANGFGQTTVKFDATTQMSTVTNFIGIVQVRFIIRNGQQLYISDRGFVTGASTAGDTISYTLQGFVNDTLRGRRWGVFNPTDVLFDIPSTLPTFSGMTFDNVTGVGVIARGSRTDTGGYIWRLNQFTVTTLNGAGVVRNKFANSNYRPVARGKTEYSLQGRIFPASSRSESKKAIGAYIIGSSVGAGK